MLTPYALGWLIIVLCVPVLILVGLLLVLRPTTKTRKGTRPSKTLIKLGEFQIETTSAGLALVALGILLLAIITGTQALPPPDFSSLSWPKVTLFGNKTPTPTTPTPTLAPTGAREVVTATPIPPTPTAPPPPPAPAATLPPAPTATFTPAPPTRIPPVELPLAPTPTPLPSGGKP